jgi:hypothetical protein
MNRLPTPTAVFLVLALAGAACATAAGRDVGFDPGPGGPGADNDGGSEGGSSSSSGGASSSSSGGSSSGDGGASSSGGPAPRVSCGGTFCRSDQQCIAGGCAFSCTGANVPGDYATLQSAVTALAAAGTDATICLKAQNTAESVSVSDPGNHGKSLKIIGVSGDKSVLGSVSVASGFSEVYLVGFGVTAGVNTAAQKVVLRGMKISSTNYGVQARALSSGPSSLVTIDGCDITGGANYYDIYVDNTYSYPFTVQVVNNYIHGGYYGLYAYGAGSQLNLSIINNTIDAAKYGLYLAPSASSSVITYTNNIISNNQQFAVHLNTGLTATHTNNALYGNVNNYSGNAVDGTGYVKLDCNMNITTPVPETKPGSPCRAVGDMAKAPAADYWNAPRQIAADIGAVQGP